MEILAFLMAHSSELVALAFAIHGVALIIVNMTKTPKDNIVLAKVYTFIEVLAGLLTVKAKK